jgi:hypothetical protein
LRNCANVCLAYIATLNLPDTLNFELAEEDVAKLSSSHQKGTPDKRQNLPVPNLLEGLSKTTPLNSVSSSPTSEFPPTGKSGGREFFSSVANVLSTFVPDGGKSSARRKLNQPPSRATSPTLPPLDIPRLHYGPGSSPPRQRKRVITVNDKMFSDAKWTVETQQFGVNGGLINAVKAAHTAGKLQNYMWIGTLGMVYSSPFDVNCVANRCAKREPEGRSHRLFR